MGWDLWGPWDAANFAFGMNTNLGVRGWTALVDTLALALWDSKSSTQPSLLDFWPTELRDVKKWTLGGRWKRGSRGRVHMHAYGWFMLMYGRNPRHTTVFSTNAMQNYHIPININELKEKVDVVLSQEMCNKQHKKYPAFGSGSSSVKQVCSRDLRQNQNKWPIIFVLVIFPF